MGDIEDLDAKIQAVKNAKAKPEKEDRSGMQAGIELFVAMLVFGAIGYFIDQWQGTKPLFMITLFFLGVIVGFYNIYRISNNISQTPTSKTNAEKGD